MRTGSLVNVLRYHPNPNGATKLLAEKGRRRQLFPRPEAQEAGYIVLVEGEPDAIAGVELRRKAYALSGFRRDPENRMHRFVETERFSFHEWAPGPDR